MNNASLRADCHQSLNNSADNLSALKNSTLLITGGTGFIGTWLAEMLMCLNDDYQFGCRIILMARHTDNFMAAHPQIMTRKDIQLLRSDVRYLTEIPRDTNWIVHAAGTPDNRVHASRPTETMSTIVEGTANVIRALDPLSNFQKMVFLSSGTVYGTQPWDLAGIPESFEGAPAASSPSSAYSEAKRCAETFCASARSEKRLPISLVRPFAFIGPYQSLNTPWAANNFLADALAHRVIKIQGDGETIRSYMYGSDAAAWILTILASTETTLAWNCGSPEGLPLKSFAEMIAQKFDPIPEVRLHAASHGNPPRTRFVPDVTLAQKKLNLTIRIPLEQAIEKTIRWHQHESMATGSPR